MKKIKISVVIPNYNRINQLKRAVNSVLNQTYSINEIIIVDDCSLSFIRDEIKSTFIKNDKIKLIFNKKNMGGAFSRNIGVQNSRNDIIAFLDSDDFWKKDKIKKQINLIVPKNNFHLVYCAQDKIELHRGNVLEQLIEGWIMPNPSSILITKESFLKIGGFDKTLVSCQDHDFWFRYSAMGFLVDYVNEELTIFTKDSKNRISNNYELRIKGAKKFLAKQRKVIIKYRNLRYYKYFCDNYLIIILYPILMNYIKKFDFFNFLKIYFKHLFLNKNFYKKLFIFIKKKIKVFK